MSKIYNLSFNSFSGNISTINNYRSNSYNTCSTNISAGNSAAPYLAAIDFLNVGDGPFSNISTLHNTIIHSSSCNISDLKTVLFNYQQVVFSYLI